MIVDGGAIKAVLDSERKGMKIAMTNGCFDLLHAGHIHALRQAAALGEVLVVAVNSDESVQRIKGPDRPVNTLADRMIVLSAIECVDYVVPFHEDTPERIICEIRPDVLVKGDEYAGTVVAGSRCAGRVAYTQSISRHSTTAIIKTIKG